MEDLIHSLLKTEISSLNNNRVQNVVWFLKALVGVFKEMLFQR